MPIIADVVVPPLAQSYSYLVPSDLATTLNPGQRVEVPLGRRRTSGYVINQRLVADQELPKDYQLKSILALEDTVPCFRSEDLAFYTWVSNYYSESLGAVLDVAIPSFVKPKLETKLYCADASFVPKGKVQQAIFEQIKNSPGITVAELSKRIPKCSSSIKRLLIKAVISAETQNQIPALTNSGQADWAKTQVELSVNQQIALDKIVADIDTSTFSSNLLFGITGSGKTEVYIEAVKHCLKLGKGALIIVPEIALTPQLIDRFIARIGTEVAVLHSGLNRGNRWNSWLALINKRTNIAIGARSAIFAPVDNLGLIIVDEEHDQSFKQGDGLRYNARDLAVARGKLSACPVVLGSATPSLESYSHARAGRYALLTLPDRPTGNRQLEIELVDLNRVRYKDKPSSLISPKLYEGLKKTLSLNQQVFIMYNKRGFASYLQCSTCADVPNCPRCNLTLTYHQYSSVLTCHYCGFNSKPTEFCKTCRPPQATGEIQEGGEEIGRYQLRGAGTEKVVDELKELFPGVEIDRLDRDAVTNFSEYRNILDRVRSEKTKILVGTQMIAKGHDLPGVTLVGVIDCDVGLHFPDFRASERVFQLITQVAGRAGRAELPGKVILQTRAPGSASLRHAINQDYEKFALEELSERRVLGYPPYCRMLRIICSGYSRSKTEDFAKIILGEVNRTISTFQLKVGVLGPTEAPLSKLRLFWRQHLIVKSSKHSELQQIMKIIKRLKPREESLRLTFDLDPQDLL